MHPAVASGPAARSHQPMAPVRAGRLDLVAYIGPALPRTGAPRTQATAADVTIRSRMARMEVGSPMVPVASAGGAIPVAPESAT